MDRFQTYLRMAVVLARAHPESSLEACLGAVLWLERRKEIERIVRATYHTDDPAEIAQIRAALRLTAAIERDVGERCVVS